MLSLLAVIIRPAQTQAVVLTGGRPRRMLAGRDLVRQCGLLMQPEKMRFSGASSPRAQCSRRRWQCQFADGTVLVKYPVPIQTRLNEPKPRQHPARWSVRGQQFSPSQWGQLHCAANCCQSTLNWAEGGPAQKKFRTASRLTQTTSRTLALTLSLAPASETPFHTHRPVSVGCASLTPAAIMGVAKKTRKFATVR